jgi:MFS family permease
LIVEVTPPERFGQALGLLGAANLATNALGPAIAEPLAVDQGWRAVFLLSAACSCLAALGSVALREPERAGAESKVSPRLNEPRQLGLLYASMVVGIAFGTLVTFYQPLALAIGITEVRDLFIGYTLTALGVRVLFGAWLDRFDRRRVAAIAASMYALVVFATAALQPGWLFSLGLGLGLAHGALYPVLSALFIEGSEVRVRGALMTYFGGAFNLGMVLSTLGFGVLAERAGYRSVFILAGLLGASSVPIILRVVHKRGARAAYG